eukprot:12744665-Alexandrium_andersonii.AAC.1
MQLKREQPDSMVGTATWEQPSRMTSGSIQLQLRRTLRSRCSAQAGPRPVVTFLRRPMHACAGRRARHHTPGQRALMPCPSSR